jgi:hypothetical protein
MPDADDLPRFCFRRSPPRLPGYAALLSGVVLAVILLRHDAPGAALLALGVFCLVTVHFLMRHRATGCDLSGTEWRFFVDDRSWRIALADIASVAVVRWGGRARGLSLTFRDGCTDMLPAALVPETDVLARELAARGVRVIA